MLMTASAAVNLSRLHTVTALV